MAAIHKPNRTYRKYEEMLSDPEVEAVIVAVSDQFHVPLALKALGAGKHVLVEKPLGTAIEECEKLAAQVAQGKLVLQVGNNRRFDPGVEFAQRFTGRFFFPFLLRLRAMRRFKALFVRMNTRSR